MQTGRPSEYSEELADRICDLIANTSLSLHKISAMEGIPSVTAIMRYLDKHEEFRAKYARAKELQAELLVDEMLSIADDRSKDTDITEFGEKENKEWINRSRLRVDTRKWLASKLYPKKYGEKVDVTSQGEKIQAPIIIDWGFDNKE